MTQKVKVLENCRVLDFSNELGFLCGKILGDLGADVIKVEKPGGDPARNLGTYYKDRPDPEQNLYWFAYNHNKRGITLDIETKTGAEIFKKLLDREEESSTVISPGLAIPHIIIEGEKQMMMFLGRCREGIIFPEADHKVHAVFVIAGTKDERNFHLRVLSAIALIVQDPKFENKWLSARNKDALRSLILLGERKRNK